MYLLITIVGMAFVYFSTWWMIALRVFWKYSKSRFETSITKMRIKYHLKSKNYKKKLVEQNRPLL